MYTVIEIVNHAGTSVYLVEGTKQEWFSFAEAQAYCDWANAMALL